MRNRARLLTVGSGDGIPAAIYGTVVAMSVIAAGAPATTGAKLAGLVALTAIVFYGAHVYAHALGESVRSRSPVDRAHVRAIARREVFIVLAAVVPVTVLLLDPLVSGSQTATAWVAMAAGVVSLGLQGLAYARVTGLGRLGTVRAVGVNVLLGLSVVALKAVVGH